LPRLISNLWTQAIFLPQTSQLAGTAGVPPLNFSRIFNIDVASGENFNSQEAPREVGTEAGRQQDPGHQVRVPWDQARGSGSEDV
jgi:hypothetical protein